MPAPWEMYQQQTPIQGPWANYAMPQQRQPTPQPQAMTAQAPLTGRAKTRQDIEAEQRAGLYGPVEAGVHKFAQAGVRPILEAGYKGIGAGIKALTPEPIERAVGAGASKVAGAISGLPSFGGGTIGERIPGELAGLAKEHPLATRRLKTAGVVAETVPMLKGGAMVTKAGTELAGPAISNLKSKMSFRDFDALKGSMADIKEASNIARSKLKEVDAVLPPSQSIETWSRLDDLFPTSATTAERGLYKNNLKAIDDFKTDVEAGNMDLKTLDQHRQKFGNIAKDITNPNRAQEAQKATEAIRIIDDFTENLAKSGTPNQQAAANALLQSRAEYAKFKNFGKIVEEIKKVSADPTKAGSIDPVKLRNRFKTLSTNSKWMLGFSDAEKALINNIAKQNTVTGVTDLLAKFGLDAKHIMTKGLVLGPAGYFSLPAATGLAVTGTATKIGKKVAAKGRVGELLRTIEARPTRK